MIAITIKILIRLAPPVYHNWVNSLVRKKITRKETTDHAKPNKK
jgi:hypothetical protein